MLWRSLSLSLVLSVSLSLSLPRSLSRSLSLSLSLVLALSLSLSLTRSWSQSQYLAVCCLSAVRVALSQGLVLRTRSLLLIRLLRHRPDHTVMRCSTGLPHHPVHQHTVPSSTVVFLDGSFQYLIMAAPAGPNGEWSFSSWGKHQGPERLQFHRDAWSGPGPVGAPLKHTDPVPRNLEPLKKRAKDMIGPESLADREGLRRQEPQYPTNAPSRMTVAPEDNLRSWAPVLQRDLGCDNRSCAAFTTLVKQGALGLHGGLMTIAHLIKDNSQVPASRPRSKTSVWLRRASEEARQALQNKNAWRKNISSGSARAAGPSGSSSVAWSNWQPTGGASRTWSTSEPAIP